MDDILGCCYMGKEFDWLQALLVVSKVYEGEVVHLFQAALESGTQCLPKPFVSA